MKVEGLKNAVFTFGYYGFYINSSCITLIYFKYVNGSDSLFISETYLLFHLFNFQISKPNFIWLITLSADMPMNPILRGILKLLPHSVTRQYGMLLFDVNG